MKLANAPSRARWLMLSLLLVTRMGAAGSDLSLLEAVKRQDKVTALALIELKSELNVDVNAAQSDGATALHWAVHHDDLETAKLLIESGAIVAATNDFGVMPLSLACTNRNASMIEALLKAGADPNARLLTGETPLMTAAHSGGLEAVDVLLRYGADVNAKEPVREQTALMWALGEKHTEVARKLVEHGADIHAVTKMGFDPLLFAAREGDLESARMLLDAGADANTTTKDMKRALHEAFLDALGAPRPAKKTGRGDLRDDLSAVHVAALRGHVEVAALLLERGADPNYDGPGYTPLHWAAGSWETELNGANGMRAPNDHEWHRMPGVKEGKFELVKALLEHGADPNALLQKNPRRYGFTVTSTRPKDSTPYVLAARAGEADIMRLLADHGADPSLKPQGGVPALLWAAGLNQHRAENVASEDDLLAAVQMAVELGADVNTTDPRGNTALHGAAWIRSTKIVQFLVDSGADVHALNKAGQTPLYVAQRDGRFAGSPPIVENSPVADLLRELSVPDVVTKSLEEWPNIPRHIRDAVELLLRGELENLEEAQKPKERRPR